MNFSGIIDETNGMTMTRLIERIVHTDTPGELRLHDEASGRKAMVAIRRGMVEEVHFGDLTGDPALTAIAQVMPWSFEFVGDQAGSVPSHPSMVSRKPRARTVVRKATPAVPDPEEMPVISNSPQVVPAEAAPEDINFEELLQIADSKGILKDLTENHSLGNAQNLSALPAEAGLSSAHVEWISSGGTEHCIHFGTAGALFLGAIHEDDHGYFQSDYDFLRRMGDAIAKSLECESPAVLAIAEVERATGYCVIPGGFLGIFGGAGTGVRHVIDFPEISGSSS